MLKIATIKAGLAKRLIGLTLFLLGAWTLPYLWCQREAGSFFANKLPPQLALQRGVEQWVQRDLTLSDYRTNSSLFSGEWLFGTYLMAGLGFGQMAILHPELKERNLPLMERCIERILTPELRAFDHAAWGNDPIDTLRTDSFDHAAFLGYFNLLLSLHRQLDPASPYAQLNDTITAALVRRLEQSPTLLLETYPSERYPVDNCAVIGSIGLYDRATGADHAALIQRWSANCQHRYIDPRTGLLIQAIGAAGEALDEPRGSGSALGIYFLAHADPAFARRLYQAVKKELATTVMNFGAVREYPRGCAGGTGDIDSGPVIFGYGFSATGFTIAGSRMTNDAAFFRRLYATAYAAGAPYDHDGARTFVTGGPLGTAILFAMCTSLPLPEEP